MTTFALHGKYLVQQQIAADKVQIIYNNYPNSSSVFGKVMRQRIRIIDGRFRWL